MIPVYAFLFIPARIALAGDYKRFLERTAKIQAGLLICVYCLSYAPALLTLERPSAPDGVPAASAADQDARLQKSPSAADDAAPPPAAEKIANDKPPEGGTVRLLFFFVLMVQLSDALQYAWAQIPSRHVIVPSINPTRTWEGLLGGSASVTLDRRRAVVGHAVPLVDGGRHVAGDLLMGFAGSMTMSAIKRDRGVKDYGTLVEGHGGVLDRIDSHLLRRPGLLPLHPLVAPAPRVLDDVA